MKKCGMECANIFIENYLTKVIYISRDKAWVVIKKYPVL